MESFIKFIPASCMIAFFSITATCFLSSHTLFAASLSEQSRFQKSIVDYRSKLNPKYKKVRRNITKYIVVHTSELGFKSTMKVVSSGKRLRNDGYTNGGHIHYVISRNGTAYRIMDSYYIADHAGKSMWNGESDISNISIGIELVGYHYDAISYQQYRSLSTLIDILQKMYGLTDRSVLTHSQIAYGEGNRWFRKKHRGRKRCAKNFIHEKAGVKRYWMYDPDVRAHRLLPDPQLANVLYGKNRYIAGKDDHNIISGNNSAWSIAGEDYDDPTTLYKFPDGRVFSGSEIAKTIGWGRIPKKTKVLLNQEDSRSHVIGGTPTVKVISKSSSAYEHAGEAYNHRSTIYIFPSGRIKLGSSVNDREKLPVKTKLMMGYRGPFKLIKGEIPFQITSHLYNDPQTIYYLPSKELVSGDEITDFKRIPAGTVIFLPFM